MPAPDILPLAPTLGPSPGQGVGSLSPGWGTGWGQPGRRSVGCRLLLAFCVSMEPLVGINGTLGSPCVLFPCRSPSTSTVASRPFLAARLIPLVGDIAL